MNTARSRSRPRGRVFRVLRAIAVLVLVLLLLPYLIAPLYRFIDPVSTVMVWRWVKGLRVERSFVPLDRMAEVLPRSVVAAEDGNYCRHRGVDWRGMSEAFYEADSIGEMRGGSTITQQVAKNLFLWNGRSVIRKGLEIPLAMWVDLVLSKQRILEIYLNIAEMGPSGQFGAQAGAEYAFKRPASSLSAREAALLAAILPNPVTRSARTPGPGVRRLAGTYMARAQAAELQRCWN